MASLFQIAQTPEERLGRAPDLGREAAKDLKNLLFGLGKPESEEAKMLRSVMQRQELSPEARKLRQRIELSIENFMNDVFAEMTRQIQEEIRLGKKTEADLAQLDRAVRMLGVTGQTAKVLEENPYVKKETGGSQAERDILEPSELVILERFHQYLQSLDKKELARMFIEDQRYIDMLLWAQNQQGKDIQEPLPKIEGKADRAAIPEGTLAGERPRFNPSNPEQYRQDLEDLYHLILGDPEVEGQEKSRNRQIAEAFLWVNIVRNLTTDQKKDLLVTFLEHDRTAGQARDFIHAALSAGAMNLHEVMDISAEANNPESPHGKEFLALEPYLQEFADTVKEREKKQVEFRRKMEQVKAGGRIESAVNHYLTFGKLGGAILVEVGRMTLLASFILNIADSLRTRGEREEGIAKAAGRGLVKTIKDRNFYVGLGEVAAGTHIIEPWISSTILAPSKLEKETAAQAAYRKELHGEMLNHTKFAEYFTDHYDEWKSFASRVDHNGRIYAKDIELTDEKAKEMGYPDADTAKAKIMRYFWICTSVLKEQRLHTKQALSNYFSKNIFTHGEHA